MFIRGVESPLWNQVFLGLHTGVDLSPPFAHLDGYEEMRGARCLSISGGGPSGGGTANPLTSLYVGGRPPVNASLVGEIIDRHGMSQDLEKGIVPTWVRDVPGSPMQQLNTVAHIKKATIDDLIDVSTHVDEWVWWMPRFIKSHGIPTGQPGAITHEVLMDGGASHFHYQAWMESGPVDGGFQIRWWIQPRPDFQIDRKAKGLRINNGSWTFAPSPRGGTYMAYQIHVEADINSLLLKVFRPIIMRITLGEFDQIISAINNRSVDRTWTRNSGTNPSGQNFRLMRY